MSAIIDRVIEASGGIVALARELGITHNAIYSWKVVPPRRVPAVEAITGIPRRELNPEVYGEYSPPSTQPHAGEAAR